MVSPPLLRLAPLAAPLPWMSAKCAATLSSRLPPQQGFPSLRVLDISSNALPSLDAARHSLAPLGGSDGCLEQLRLSSNPLAAGRRGERNGGQVPADEAAPAGYLRAVLRTLPHLQELDRQVVSEEERPQLVQVAARCVAAVPRRAARAGMVGAGANREAQTVLWLLSQAGALALLEQSEAQQQALAAARLFSQAAGQPPAPGAEGMAAALAALQGVAASGLPPSQQHGSEMPPAGPSCWSEMQPGRPSLLRQVQQLYLLLARDEAGVAQDLLLLNPEPYQRLLARLHGAATCIQAAWRCFRAVRLRRHLAAQQRACKEAAAAARVQAAWRGWVCRHRSHRHVQARLLAWRHAWREAQHLLVEHERGCAAVRLQARHLQWPIRAAEAKRLERLLHCCSASHARHSQARVPWLRRPPGGAGACAACWCTPSSLCFCSSSSRSLSGRRGLWPAWI